MGLDVQIKQRVFGNKTMPLEVILGNILHYGSYDNYQLMIGELGETEFIAYNPKCIGRGFSIIWTPKENKEITLRLPLPSTNQEIKDFYEAVERMVKYWNGKLIVDNQPMNLSNFMAGLDTMMESNSRIIKDLARRVLDSGHSFLLASAMWDLSMGVDEAKLFFSNSDNFTKWLHKRQLVDANYKIPRFYKADDSIFGLYLLFNDEPSLFPYHPVLPKEITEYKPEKRMVFEGWKVWLIIKGEKTPLCEMDYDKFVTLLPDDIKLRYDAERFYLRGLTEEEVRQLATKN